MVVFVIKIQLLKLTDQSISLATFCNLGKFRFPKDMLGMILTYFRELRNEFSLKGTPSRKATLTCLQV